MPTKTTPKDFFLNLGSIVALYISIVSFISLAYALIGKFFPDALNYYSYDGSLSTIRWAVSSLIVAFPLHIYLLSLIQKDIVLVPEKKNVWVKKWSTYLTLFLAGLTIGIDVIFLIYNFLGGEITVQFISKVMVVLVVSLFVFIFHIHDLHRTDYTSDKKAKIMIAIGSVAVVVVIILGFIKAGSPMEERLRKFDDTRVQDLMSIQYQIVNYWQNKGSLPQVLSDLNDPLSSFVVPVDPVTGSPYEYDSKDKTNFELCATFTSATRPSEVTTLVYPPNSTNSFSHEKGYVCFERNIDEALYPVMKR